MDRNNLSVFLYSYLDYLILFKIVQYSNFDFWRKFFIREGPKLNIGRSNHACYVHYQAEDEMGSHFAKNMAGKTYIGVYGGMQHFHIMKSTEFLFSNDNEWQVGPDLFRQMMDTTAVFYYYNRGVVLSGTIIH